MHGDGFGCLHTEDISGHKIEGLPFLRKNHPLSFYSRVVRLAFRPFAQKKGHFLAHVIFLLYLCSLNLRADNKRDKKKPPRVLIHKRPGTSSRQTGGVASAEKGKNMTYNRNKHIGNKYYAAIYNII